MMTANGWARCLMWLQLDRSDCLVLDSQLLCKYPVCSIYYITHIYTSIYFFFLKNEKQIPKHLKEVVAMTINRKKKKIFVLKFLISPFSFCCNFFKFPFSLLTLSVRLVPDKGHTEKNRFSSYVYYWSTQTKLEKHIKRISGWTQNVPWGQLLLSDLSLTSSSASAVQLLKVLASVTDYEHIISGTLQPDGQWLPCLNIGVYRYFRS